MHGRIVAGDGRPFSVDGRPFAGNFFTSEMFWKGLGFDINRKEIKIPTFKSESWDFKRYIMQKCYLLLRKWFSNKLVELSCAFTVPELISSKMELANCLPNSTPHWS